MIRTLVMLASLAIGNPSLRAPALHELPWVDAWRLLPHHPANHAVREAGPRLAPLALAIAWRESGMNPLAISGPNSNHTYDLGLFGLNTHTIKVLHVANPFDPDQNMIAGIGLLRMYIEMHGQTWALCAYARGPGKCREYK